MIHFKIQVVVTDDEGRVIGSSSEEIRGEIPLARSSIIENGVGVARKALWDAYTQVQPFVEDEYVKRAVIPLAPRRDKSRHW
jgi:hypothetical protein